MVKRKVAEKDLAPTDAPAGGATIGMLTSGIRNKAARSEAYGKLKTIKKKEVRKARKKRQKEALSAEMLGQTPVKQTPRTIENTRADDVTFVRAEDADIAVEEQQDEFAAHFNNDRPPHVLLTTCYKCSSGMYKFCADLMNVFPSAVFYKRSNLTVKKIVDKAVAAKFTDVVIVNEDSKKVNGLVVCHLPHGPTAHFTVSSVTLARDIPGHGAPTPHKPELVLNHFSTRLGLRVGRMFGSLFCQDPTFRGRRVVTFHNQRDFVFFRHHRYIFEEKAQKVLQADVNPATGKRRARVAGEESVVHSRLQELGPRFTLKLTSLQKGTFDTRTGEFEWVHKRGEMDTSRRKFHL